MGGECLELEERKEGGKEGKKERRKEGRKTNPQRKGELSVVVEGLQQTNQQVGATDLKFKSLLKMKWLENQNNKQITK